MGTAVLDAVVVKRDRIDVDNAEEARALEVSTALAKVGGERGGVEVKDIIPEGRREFLGHKFGTVFKPGEVTPLEAIQRIGADYEVRLEPIPAPADGSWAPSDKLLAVVRDPIAEDPERRQLGIVSKGFKPIQNRDLARALEPIAKEYPLEVAGMSPRGEALFLIMNAGTYKVGGQDVTDYLAAVDGKAGERSLSISIVGNRWQCSNALVSSLAAAIASVKIRHTATVEEEFANSLEIMASLKGKLREQREMYDRMAYYVADGRTLEQYFDRVYPDPRPGARARTAMALGKGDAPRGGGELYLRAAKDYDSMVQAIRARRQTAKDLLGIWNEENPKLANTVWGAWQTVVELEDRRPTTIRDDQRLAYTAILEGERASTKALGYKMAVDLMGRAN